MRFFLTDKTHSGARLDIIYGGIAVLLLVAARLLPVLEIAPSCPFKALAGFPCPTCGSTRSIVHLAHGDFTAAFSMNPLISSVFSVILLFFLYGVIAFFLRLPLLNISLNDREKTILRFSGVSLIVFNWTYLLFSV